MEGEGPEEEWPLGCASRRLERRQSMEGVGWTNFPERDWEALRGALGPSGGRGDEG